MARLNMNAAMDHRISKEIATYGDAWFEKERIAAKVVASYAPLPAVKGLDLRKVVHGYVKDRVTQHLQAHDEKGWRLYESYRAGTQWRWQRARAMDTPTLLNVIDRRREQLDKDTRALKRLEALHAAMVEFEEANKKPAIVADVIASIP
jgi:hypothetical protein